MLDFVSTWKSQACCFPWFPVFLLGWANWLLAEASHLPYRQEWYWSCHLTFCKKEYFSKCRFWTFKNINYILKSGICPSHELQRGYQDVHASIKSDIWDIKSDFDERRHTKLCRRLRASVKAAAWLSARCSFSQKLSVWWWLSDVNVCPTQQKGFCFPHSLTGKCFYFF